MPAEPAKPEAQVPEQRFDRLPPGGSPGHPVIDVLELGLHFPEIAEPQASLPFRRSAPHPSGHQLFDPFLQVEPQLFADVVLDPSPAQREPENPAQPTPSVGHEADRPSAVSTS